MNAYPVSKIPQRIEAAVADQVAATRNGLELLQVGANKSALNALCQEKDAGLNEGLPSLRKVNHQVIPADIYSSRHLESDRRSTNAMDEINQVRLFLCGKQ